MNFQENFRSIKRKLDVGLDDYGPIDPSPDSGAKNVNPGPIEHGTPLMPYIPKPPPPSHGQDDYNQEQLVLNSLYATRSNAKDCNNDATNVVVLLV